jgi:ABC-2 type transport system permease protein
VFLIDGAGAGAIGLITSTIALFCGAMGVLSIGLALAWRIDSVAGFHGVMNILLLPAWVLSGAMFPVDGASGWLSIIMKANPLHWVHRCVGSGIGATGDAGVLAWSVTVFFPLACVGLMLLTIRRSGGRRGAGDA